jgi:hypothetical protein
MNLPYFTFLHWLAIAFFIILFIALSLLSATAKKNSIVVSGIFASFLVSVFGAVLSIIILEKYTKKGAMIKVSERRILFNETMVVKGTIVNVGKFPLNYCTVSIKLINNDRKQFGKGTFFKSGGLSIFGDKEKKLAKPNTVYKEQVFKFKPPLKPNYRHPFSVTLKYPGYFRGAMIIKKIYCH